MPKIPPDIDNANKVEKESEIITKRKLPHPLSRTILISSKSRLGQLSKPFSKQKELVLQSTGKAILRACELVLKLQKEYDFEYEMTSFSIDAVDDIQVGLDYMKQRKRRICGIRIVMKRQ